MQPVCPPEGPRELTSSLGCALDQFLDELRARGLSERTRDEYRRLIARFLQLSPDGEEPALHSFVFGPGPSGRLPAPATVALRKAALMSFYGFMCRHRLSARNPVLGLPQPRRAQAAPRGLSHGEIRRLLDAIPDTPSGRRDRAAVITALFTGLRRRELFSLRLGDLDFSGPPTLRIRVKGGEERLRQLPPPVIAAIETSIRASGLATVPTGRTPLFAVSAAGFAANLRRYAQRAAIRGVTPHVLRHTAAKLRREAGASIEEVSEFLGHRSIATTAIYLHRLTGWRDNHWADVSRLLSIPSAGRWPMVEARAGPTQEWPSERGNAHSADWQGGPGNGTPLPTTYSSSAREEAASRTADSTAMTPPWRDERIPLLKSALQKYIRRGNVDQAHAVAARLIALPGGRSALARRLPVIAAEDVGVHLLPASLVPGDGPEADTELLRVTRGLSALPKSKEAYWLAASVWEGRLPIGGVSAADFREALEAGDHRLAVAIALTAREQRAWRSGERLISLLQHAIMDGPPLALAIARAALEREAKGGFGVGELIAAAIIAAIERPDGPIPVLPSVAPPAAARLRLAWYVADGHTAVGRRALRRVAFRLGLLPKLLADLMFCFESVVLGPSELPSRWQPQAVAMDAVAYGWRTHEHGAELWRTIRQDVSSAIEGELSGIRL